MVYTYTPTYYSSFQDTLTSLCKSILLPFSLKNRRLPGDQKFAKKQSDNLKWQQESFHKILNLMGLNKEGIVADAEVSRFRSHLLDTLIASPGEQEPVGLIRDKLLFLQELLYAKCISADEYHSSKRPLLQRLAIQGVELDCKDVIIGDPTTTTTKSQEDEEEEEEQWSVIELRDNETPTSAEKAKKHKTPIKSLINWKNKDKRARDKNTETAAAPSILMPESSEKSKRKPFRSLFDKEQKWKFDGLKKWKKNGNCDQGEPHLLSEDRSDDNSSSVNCTLVASPIGEGPDTKRIKKKIHSNGASSDFFIDKVLGDNIKKELSRIQTELSATHPNLNLSDDQMEAISTRLPVDKADLNNFFPKSWCDKHGDIVIDVVKKEFKEHVGEMKEKNESGSTRWVAFEENEENYNPNLFFRDHPALNPGKNYDGGRDSFVNNPFIDGDDDDADQNQSNAASKKENDGSRDCYLNNPFVEDQNPFWVSRN